MPKVLSWDISRPVIFHICAVPFRSKRSEANTSSQLLLFGERLVWNDGRLVCCYFVLFLSRALWWGRERGFGSCWKRTRELYVMATVTLTYPMKSCMTPIGIVLFWMCLNNHTQIVICITPYPFTDLLLRMLSQPTSPIDLNWTRSCLKILRVPLRYFLS